MDYTSLGCCALAFVLYLNTLNAGFVYDDRRAILGNTDVSGSTEWMKAFQHDYWGTPLTDSGSHGSYRPLCVLTFKVNYIFGGYTPWGYHLINNLMHCLATGLVVKLARQLLSSVWGIVATGALFAAHPIHTEAVAGIVGRADLAACIFYLLTYLTFIKHIVWRERNDSRQWLALSLTIGLSVCAVLFKETAVTALVVCAIFDIIRGFCGFSDKNRYRTVSIITAAFITILYMRLSVPGPRTTFSTADNPIAKSNSIWTRFLTFLYLPVFNFKLLLYPSMLSFDWGMDAIPRITTIYDIRNLFTVSFYTIIVATAWHSIKLIANQTNKFPRVAQQRKSRTKKKMFQFNQNGIVGNNIGMGNVGGIACKTYEAIRVSTGVSMAKSVLASMSSSSLLTSSARLRGNGGARSCRIENTIVTKGGAQTFSNSMTATLRTAAATASETSTLSSGKAISFSESIASSLELADSMSTTKNECVCQICKHELTIRHTSSCRAINNNNIPGPYTDCGCLLEWSSFPRSVSPVLMMMRGHRQYQSQHHHHAQTSHQQHNHLYHNSTQSVTKSRMPFYLTETETLTNTDAVRIMPTSTTRTSLRETLTTSKARGKIIAAAETLSVAASFDSSISSPVNSHSCSQHVLYNLPPRMANGIVLVMAIVLLTLPFLPASNLFFYVGFVVAERILYLPSVGYCLLVGFGISKLMHPMRNPKKRLAVVLCMSLLLSMLSVRTWKRNYDWKDEESLYRSAISVNPPKALGNLGSVLSTQGRYQEAKEVLLEALKYRPNMADVHFNLGILHQNQQNFKSAVENFQRAIQFRPNLAIAYLNLGTSLIALGRCQEAATILKEGTKVDGTGVRDRSVHDNARISSYLQLGSLYADQGKLQRALAVYREALHALSSNYQREVLYHRLGDIFGRLQQWDEAERYHRAALDLQPDHVAAHLSYGITLAKNSSRVSEAELWFKRALKLAPTQASAYHHYADFLSSLSRNDEACAYRIKAAELSPNDYSLVVSAATALRLLDKKLDAEKWYRKAVQIRPDDARAHTNLGAILHLLGRTQKAAASYKEALRLQPGDPTTLGNLAKLGIIEVK